MKTGVTSFSTVDGADVALGAGARVFGTPAFGAGVYLAHGAAVRAMTEGAVSVGAQSYILENCSVVGAAEMPATIGRKTVLGHHCRVVGATLGDLCEIGNATIIMRGARLGDRVFTGEGTLIPAGAAIADDSVVVGRPGRVVRRVTEQDVERLAGLREGGLALPSGRPGPFQGLSLTEPGMGNLYKYKDKTPQLANSVTLFEGADVTGDVAIGADSVVAYGVRILGDGHGPVRIGARVQILENTVLHLLPDNELILEDDVIIGPGAMIHGCRIGAGTVVEPAAIVCDGARLGRGCLVKAGALVKQGDAFGDGTILEGFPAREIGRLDARPERPAWALDGLPERAP